MITSARARVFCSYRLHQRSVPQTPGQTGQVGVELAQRTGRNPNYEYLQIGCSQHAVDRMLQWSRQQVGKPFSAVGMARALFIPRRSTASSWYCAELVAACLQAGGLMSAQSNPGAATPQSLHSLYKRTGAIMANPCTLRRQHAGGQPNTNNTSADMRQGTTLPRHEAAPLGLGLGWLHATPPQPACADHSHRATACDSTRTHFRVVQERARPAPMNDASTTRLTFHSLSVTRSSHL